MFVLTFTRLEIGGYANASIDISDPLVLVICNVLVFLPSPSNSNAQTNCVELYTVEN